ncbi:zinc-binding dehydrogenase [Streptomyces phaeochromogenes]
MIPKTMHAMVLTGHGGLDKLVHEKDWPVPSPGRGEVLVKVGACGINNMDLNARTGWYGSTVTEGMTEKVALEGAPADATDLGNWNRDEFVFPRIQGSAIAGTVVAVGEGVDVGRVGQRVMVDPVLRDEQLPFQARGVGSIGSDTDGGFAEYAAVPSSSAIEVKGKVSFVELAGFPVSHTTAEEMLVRADVKAGDKVVVRGAGGGVGTALIQLAHIRGAIVLAIASAEKEAEVRALGASEFVARDVEDQTAAVLSVFGRRGVDVLCDVVGGESSMGMLSLLRRGGKFVTAGALAGPISPVDLREIIYKDLQILGVASPELETTVNLVRYIEAGQITAHVDRVFPLVQLREAQRAFVEKKFIGKLVIQVPEDDLSGSPGL